MKDIEKDERIKQALRDADEKGKLGIVAAIVGIAGGQAELRRLMTGEQEMTIIDRGMLWMHLGE